MKLGRKTPDPMPLVAARTKISAKRIRQLLRMTEKEMRRLSPTEAAVVIDEHKQIQAAQREIMAELSTALTTLKGG